MQGTEFVCGCWVCLAAPVLHATAAPTILWVCGRLGGSLCREGAPTSQPVSRVAWFWCEGFSWLAGLLRAQEGLGHRKGVGAFFCPRAGAGVVLVMVLLVGLHSCKHVPAAVVAAVAAAGSAGGAIC